MQEKKKYLLKAISLLCFALLFSGPSFGRFFCSVVIFIGMLLLCFSKKDRIKKEESIYSFLIAFFLSCGGAAAFWLTWRSSGKAAQAASFLGLSQNVFVIIAAALLACAGYWAVLCAIRHILWRTEAIFGEWGLKAELRKVLFEYKPFFVPTLVVFVITNSVFLLNQNLHPDAMTEGFDLYVNAGWALALGRWAIRFLSLSTDNIVFPFLSLFISYLCIFAAGVIVAKIFEIKSPLSRFLTITVLLTTPTVIYQYMYIYMEIAYSIGVLFSALAAYLIIQKKTVPCAAGSVLLCIALGCYQSYIGFFAGLIYLFLIYKLLNEDADMAEAFREEFRYILWGILGCVLYVIVLFFNLKLFHRTLSQYGGADSIGLSNSLEKLFPSVQRAYQAFLAFHAENKVIFLLYGMFLLLLIAAIAASRSSLKNKAAAVILLPFVPLVLNCVVLIAPDNEISTLMQHQNVLILPFALALTERENYPALYRGTKQILTVLVSAVCFVFSVMDFCTQYSMNYAQKKADFMASSAIMEIQRQSDYDRTDRILFAGVFDRDELQRGNPLYPYSVFKENCVVDDYENAVLRQWGNYTKARLGYDIATAGAVSREEYEKIVKSAAFQDMSCYPGKNSIAKADDIYVVKIENEPPLE